MNKDRIEAISKKVAEYEKQVLDNWKNRQQNRKESLAKFVLDLVDDLNAVWESEDVWERAQLKAGTQTIIQIIDSMTGNIKVNERIVVSNDGVRIEIGDTRYKIKNWGMRDCENYTISAETVNGIYKSICD